MVSGSPTVGNSRCAAAGAARVAASRPPTHHYNAFGPHSGNSPNSTRRGLATLFAFSLHDGGYFVLGTAEQEGDDDQQRMNVHTMGVMARGLQQYSEVSVNWRTRHSSAVSRAADSLE